MACKCAHNNVESRYSCDVSGDECMFFIPDSKACAVVYGEGPDADHLDKITCCCSDCGKDFTADQLKPNKLKCPACGSENIHLGSYDDYVKKQTRAKCEAEDDYDDWPSPDDVLEE